MLKIIDTSSYYPDEPSVKIIDPGAVSGLVKQAEDSRITDYVGKLKPESGKIFVHILAMGAAESFGKNRNADKFFRKQLIDYHKTFETNPAYVYRNHNNKDKNNAIGKVLFSVFNERMDRVELICEIWSDKAQDVVDRIEEGDWPSTSMACRTPADYCSICGNRATTRQSYCPHLSEELGRMYPDGRDVAALNLEKLSFMDISVVIRPADITSSVLQKVASEEDRVIGSAELAEIEGLTEKTANLKKLSEFVKEITGGVAIDADPSLEVMLAKVKDPSHDAIDLLRNYDIKAVLCSLADLGMSPSIGWLAEFIARKTLGQSGEGIGDLVEGYVKEMGLDGLPIAEKDFGEPEGPNLAVVSALMPYVKQASLMPEHVASRLFTDGGRTYIEGTNVGFAGNGPRIEPTPYERFRAEHLVPESAKPGGLSHVVKTLMVIGGAALAAKWYITQLIEKKMKEVEQSRALSDAKIGLVEKRASDYRSAHRLAESEMVKLIRRR